LQAKRLYYDKLFRYYDGDQPLVYASKRLEEIFQALDAYFAENWCSVVIDAVRDRINLRMIEVKGAATIDPGVIRQYVDHVLNDGPRHYLSRSNIFLYPRSVIEKDIVIDFPRIKSATLSRPSFFSTTLIVTVQERTFFALWCPDASKQGCYQMDDSGYIFAEAAVDNPAKYIFGGGLPSAPSTIGQVFAPSHLSEIIALLERFTQTAYIPEGAIVENPRDFSVPLKDRFIIKASFDMDPDTLIKNLQLILSNPPLRGNERNVAYIDLRFGNRVYYKLKNASQSEAIP